MNEALRRTVLALIAVIIVGGLCFVCFKIGSETVREKYCIEYAQTLKDVLAKSTSANISFEYDDKGNIHVKVESKIEPPTLKIEMSPSTIW
jgi:hypothetical protein